MSYLQTYLKEECSRSSKVQGAQHARACSYFDHEWLWHVAAVPKQDNGRDCGMFVLMYAWCIIHGRYVMISRLLAFARCIFALYL